MITMSDIARRAGVSRSTASFVLNGRETGVRISDGTRQRVLQVAREIGYQRNELAVAISTGKNFVLGYLPSGSCESQSRILEGSLEAAAEAGYLLKLLPKPSSIDIHRPDEEETTRRCVEQRLAGLIVRRFPQERVAAFCSGLETYGIPTVFTDENPVAPGINYVTTDDHHGYQLAIEHLVSLGHRRIALIGGNKIFPQSVMRQDSFREVMHHFGLPVLENEIKLSRYHHNLVPMLVGELFHDPLDRPTALLCDGDHLAAVAVRTLRQLGLRVPQDVSVVGYGSFTYAQLCDPPLTTIAQPFEEMGKTAVRYLLQRIESGGKGQEMPLAELLPTRLVLGESTAPVRAE